MENHEKALQSLSFKDRKVGLVVFGILEIILGVLCVLMVFGMVVSVAFVKIPGEQMSARMIIPAVVFYVLLAVWFIWMGIGSIKTRRWARALLLVSSWFWLVSGIGAFTLILAFIPEMFSHHSQVGQTPKETFVCIKYLTLVFMSFIYVIIPGALVWFYGSRNVKATCEFRDPQMRWTDKCPLPVLALSLMFGLWAASMLFMGFSGWVIPFFGYIPTGIAGSGIALTGTLLFIYVALGTYRLDLKAWWCAILLTIAWGTSTIITFTRLSLWDYYEKMNLPAQQLEIMKQHSMLQSSTIVLFCIVWMLGLLAYLLYTRRYFTAPSAVKRVS